MKIVVISLQFSQPLQTSLFLSRTSLGAGIKKIGYLREQLQLCCEVGSQPLGFYRFLFLLRAVYAVVERPPGAMQAVVMRRIPAKNTKDRGGQSGKIEVPGNMG